MFLMKVPSKTALLQVANLEKLSAPLFWLSPL
jgi:hypothetical protein